MTANGSQTTRSTGITDSERYLARLADKSFLNLWSYPNTYNDKFHGGQGKELCDLLVVCGRHVIIFSDKTIKWPKTADTGLAWTRWYRRAIEDSVTQLNGAARWITEHPNRIFLDKECTKPLPIQLPAPDEMTLHGIVVARGAGKACRQYCAGGTGSLVIVPGIRGKDHFSGDEIEPFAIGDVNPGRLFVHVLDDGSLDIVMHELDTISDLTSYLSKKERLVRSGHLVAAHGEEDLVAYYATHMETGEEHGFCRPDGSPLGPDDQFSIGPSYSDLRSNPQYIAKKQADEVSYLWDNLIRKFTDNMLAGTTVVPQGEIFDLRKHEQGVRYMALVPRFHRRNYGAGIAGALDEGRNHDRFVRSFIPTPGSPDSETGYFFMTLKVPKFEHGGYEGYRKSRSAFLEIYALSVLDRYKHLRRVVGIATEPPGPKGERSKGSSEDLILAEVPEWTDSLLTDLRERQKGLNIMQEGNYRQYDYDGPKEWPVVRRVPASGDMNRQQRRAAAARERRNRRKR